MSTKLACAVSQQRLLVPFQDPDGPRARGPCGDHCRQRLRQWQFLCGHDPGQHQADGRHPCPLPAWERRVGGGEHNGEHRTQTFPILWICSVTLALLEPVCNTGNEGHKNVHRILDMYFLIAKSYCLPHLWVCRLYGNFGLILNQIVVQYFCSCKNLQDFCYYGGRKLVRQDVVGLTPYKNVQCWSKNTLGSVMGMSLLVILFMILVILANPRMEPISSQSDTFISNLFLKKKSGKV